VIQAPAGACRGFLVPGTSVARMERSEIRDPRPRIALRSMRATGLRGAAVSTLSFFLGL
jgi:hypothetical protein